MSASAIIATPRSLDEIESHLAAAVERSPADETSIAWLDTWSRRCQTGRQGATEARPRTTVLVKVMEAGRLGVYRGGAAGPAELDAGVRLAMAHARGSSVVPGFPHLPAPAGDTPVVGTIFDPEVAELDPADALGRLDAAARPGERLRCDWAAIRLAIRSSRGVSRAARATEIKVVAQCGRAPGFGYASRSARRLADLDVDGVCARARRAYGEGPLGELPAEPFPVLLAPEAVAALVDLASRRALTAQSYEFGDSFLRDYLGVQVFDRSLTIVDDGSDPAGLPFPFDLEGTPKTAVAFIESGVPRTPALDQYHAALLGLPPTPHACTGDDARGEHLFVTPGELGPEELLAFADGGIWVSRFERPECYDPKRLLVRAVAQGVRRVENGALGRPLPSLVWEGSLLQALSQSLAIGADPWVLSDPSGILGAVTTPGLGLGQVVGFRLARPREDGG